GGVAGGLRGGAGRRRPGVPAWGRPGRRPRRLRGRVARPASWAVRGTATRRRARSSAGRRCRPPRRRNRAVWRGAGGVASRQHLLGVDPAHHPFAVLERVAARERAPLVAVVVNRLSPLGRAEVAGVVDERQYGAALLGRLVPRAHNPPL